MLEKNDRVFFRRAFEDENPYMIVWNELFDAIPVYQFIYNERKGWLEKVIMANKDKELEIVDSEKPTHNVERLLHKLYILEKYDSNKVIDSNTTIETDETKTNFETGDMIEISPQSLSIVTEMAELISLTKGCGLIIDYGEDCALSNSIRAIRKHSYISQKEMLEHPGKADLSAYVNFQALRLAGKYLYNVMSYSGESTEYKIHRSNASRVILRINGNEFATSSITKEYDKTHKATRSRL